MISVIVPTRPHESLEPTLRSLMDQTRQDFEVHVIVDHDGRGAPWARNRGAECARGEYVLFCDNDIRWKPWALQKMVTVLERAGSEPDGDGFTVAYAYGGYRINRPRGDGSIGPMANEPWHLQTLKGRNLVSTMALIHRRFVQKWDEELKRLQDWDYWLRMALHQQGKGQWVGEELFDTGYRAGITHEGAVSYDDAFRLIRAKLGLG